MDILLLSRNRVIIEFVKIASKELFAELDIIDSIKKIDKEDYDVVIVDDHFSILPCNELISNSVKFKKSILLSSKTNMDRGCDYFMIKPFLPNDIVNLLKDKYKYQDEYIPKCDDIDGIESILNYSIDDDDKDEDMEIDKIFDDIEREPQNFTMDGESFIDIIKDMKSKDLKRVLKGSTVTITIKFEED